MTFFHAFRHIALFLALMILSGCASVGHQDYNAAASQNMKEIGLISAGATNEHFVNIVNLPGNSFGLIGALAAAADMSSKSDRFNKAVNPQKSDLLATLEQELSCLDRSGRFRVQRLSPQGVNPNKLLEDYSKLPRNVEAYLDIRLRKAGYLAIYPDSPYVPSLMADAQLVDAKTQVVLYETHINYGEPWLQVENLIQLQGDHSHDYPNFDQLVNHPDAARDGLRAGAQAIGQRICQDLL